MSTTVTLPLWLFILILLFAAVTFASHFLFPSVRWFFRRRLEKAVSRLNLRLDRPIEPFKLARRYDTIQRLSYDPEVIQAVAEHARTEGIPENVAAEQARDYAREIVPSFSASAYFDIAIRLARFLSNGLYKVQIGQYDGDGMDAIDRKATVIFVMNHRSNMDYVLVTYLAAQRSALSYAVGEWAHVWPLSRLIRAMGAYFIRRKSRNELYRKVLARYVQMATQAGVTQAMFPEGGLSRTGALMPPKMGLLKYIIDTPMPEGRDVVFVPVALNYDRVLEDRVLTAAANDPDHRFKASIGVVARKALGLLWLRLRGRYHRFGCAAVSFGTPLSLGGFMKGAGADPAHELGQELMARIGSIVPVLPVPLVSWLIETRGPMTREEVEAGIGELAAGLPEDEVLLPHHECARAAETGLRDLGKRGILTERDGLFEVTDSQAHLVRYYANSIRHLLPPASVDNAADAKGNSAPAGS